MLIAPPSPGPVPEPFELAIADFSPHIQELARAARQLIHRVYPQVVEVVWVRQRNTGFGTGPKKSTEHFCWLMPASNHVNLGFNYGAELPDPAGLLEGTGKLFRHVKLRSAGQLDDPRLIELVRHASTYRVPQPRPDR
jgi:hypothetical protein